MKGANKRLGEILLQEEVITPDQLDQALAEQKNRGGFLGETLVRLGFIDEEDLTTFLVKQCRIPFLKLSGFQVDPQVAQVIPPEMCHKFQVLPVDKLGTLLTLGMVNPLDIEALEQVKAVTPCRIKPIICSWFDFERLFRDYYPNWKPSSAPESTAAEAELVDPMPQGDAAPVEVEPMDARAVARVAETTGTGVAIAPVPPPAPNLTAAFTFERFLVAEANEDTVAIAHAIAEQPGQEHAPFFLYGEPGLGKTHLVNAIGHEALARDTVSHACYVHAGQFSDDMVEAIRFHRITEFRAKYRQVQMLMMDDVQFLAGRDRLQEELAQLCAELAERGDQVIVVSELAPEALSNVDPKLATFFESGTVATMVAPDFDTRLAILHQEVDEATEVVPGDVMDILANEIPDNVRELQGALKKLLAYARLVGHDITPELVREILKHLFAGV